MRVHCCTRRTCHRESLCVTASLTQKPATCPALLRTAVQVSGRSLGDACSHWRRQLRHFVMCGTAGDWTANGLSPLQPAHLVSMLVQLPGVTWLDLSSQSHGVDVRCDALAKLIASRSAGGRWTLLLQLQARSTS